MKMAYWVGLFMAGVMAAAFGDGVPLAINYQGLLTDGLGNRLTNTTPLKVTFKLYSGAQGGSPLWARANMVQLDPTNGLFNTTLPDLPDSPALDASATNTLSGVLAGNQDCFLGVTVGSSTEIAPRQKLLSVPYAMLAGDTKSASGDFTVKGIFTARNGIKANAVEATDRIMVGSTNGTASYVWLNASSKDELRVNNLSVPGNTQMAYLTAGTGTVTSLTASNLTVSNLTASTATVGSLTITNGASIFSRVVKNSTNWTQLSSPDYCLYGTNVCLWPQSTEDSPYSASSDGFIIINLKYYLNISGDKDNNDVQFNIIFYPKGGGVARTVHVGIQNYKWDGDNITIYDAYTLPVLQGERVKLNSSAFTLNKDGKVYLISTFVPFGTAAH